MIAKPATDKTVTKASDLKTGQLVLCKNHCKGPFDPAYIYNHWVAGIPNNSTVSLTTPDGKERKCMYSPCQANILPGYIYWLTSGNSHRHVPAILGQYPAEH